jgi:hypothetical protein
MLMLRNLTAVLGWIRRLAKCHRQRTGQLADVASSRTGPDRTGPDRAGIGIDGIDAYEVNEAFDRCRWPGRSSSAQTRTS